MSDPRDTDVEPVGVVATHPATPRRPHVWLRRSSIALLGLLLVALVVVIFVLPDLVAERVLEPGAPPADVEPAIPPPPEDARRRAREKREAGSKLGKVLSMQAALEADGISTWGGADYDRALDTLAAGDAELQAERFVPAAEHYDQVATQLEALRASMPERLVAAIGAGEAALAAVDGPGARAAFATALAIEPHNTRAGRGMSRARVVEDVTALVAAGAEDEGRGDLEAAREKYAAALALDGASPRARMAHDGVAARIRERDFRVAMSASLTALEGKDFTAARAALDRAEGIVPGTPEVADTRRRLRAAVERARIDDHRIAAARLEREERWQEASEHYSAVLAIDPQAAFARAGRDRSLAKARIHVELDAYLGALDRLSGAGPRTNAERLLAAAGEADPSSEPKLADKVSRLGEALTRARTPLRVTLRSDNLTEVTVYKVGRFGRFESHALLLPPGRYVALGTRSGYRDVRVEFTVVAGEEPVDVRVSCWEKI